MGVSLMLSKQYTATATLIVDQNRPDPVTGTSYAANPSPAFVATQVDVLKSDRVAQNVARKLGLANDPDVRELWMKENQGVGNFDAWLVDHIQYWLDVKPSRDSNVISVSFKDSDPAKAASIANLFVQSYLDLLLELRVDPAKQYSSFFESRAMELRANLERAQARLTAYQREKGVVIASEGQMDVETARLNELSTQLVALQAVASESGSRQSQAQAGASDRLQEVVNNPNLSALRAEIARAEAKLQEINSRLGDNHPQVIEARANIASLRSRLATETNRVTGSLGVSNSINRQREAEIRATLEAQRSRVMRMRTAREEGSVLLRDVEAAQRAYDAVATKLNQSNLEGHDNAEQRLFARSSGAAVCAVLAEVAAQCGPFDRRRVGPRRCGGDAARIRRSARAHGRRDLRGAWASVAGYPAQTRRYGALRQSAHTSRDLREVSPGDSPPPEEKHDEKS